MVRDGLLVGMLLIAVAAEGAIPPPLPCCYVWAVEKESAVIRRDGVLVRFRAAPSVIRTMHVDEPFFKVPDYAPGSKITLHRDWVKGSTGWVMSPSDAEIVVEDFLPPTPPCCEVEFIDRDTESLTVRKTDGAGRYDAVATKWQSYALPPVGRGAAASVDRKERYLFFRVLNPDRTYVMEILPPLLEPDDLGEGGHETIATLRATASIVERPEKRYEPMKLDPGRGRLSALRLLQIQGLEKHADAVVVTGCRVDELHPREMLCEGDAIRRVKAKR
jgi:hypothetical protein